MASDAVSKQQSDDIAPSRPRPRRLRIVLALASVLVVSFTAGGYFAFESLAATPAPSERSDTHVEAVDGPLPVAILAAAIPVKAKDYQIVSVFDGEAILATPDNLIRVMVGSRAAGLGTITAVDASDDGGGTVIGTEATLRTE